jgi:hypothetical protein
MRWAEERLRRHKATVAAEDAEELRFIEMELQKERDKIEARKREAYEVRLAVTLWCVESCRGHARLLRGLLVAVGRVRPLPTTTGS